MSEIDVSKCEYFKKATCFDNDFDEIEFDYCKLFDEPCEDVRNNNRCTYKLKQQIQQLKAENEALKQSEQEGLEIFAELKNENEELKNKNNSIHSIADDLQKRSHYLTQENERYIQCLDKIEKIVNAHYGTILEFYKANKKILQKIKEVKK